MRLRASSAEKIEFGFKFEVELIEIRRTREYGSTNFLTQIGGGGLIHVASLLRECTPWDTRGACRILCAGWTGLQDRKADGGPTSLSLFV